MIDLSSWQLAAPSALWALLLLPLLALLRERSPAGHPAWRSFGAMLLRGVAFAVLVLALAQPFVETTVPDRSAVFVVDASTSLDPTRTEAAATWLQQAMGEAADVPVRAVLAGEVTELIGLEALAGEAAPTLRGGDLASAVRTAPRAGASAGTDLRSALEVGLANLPEARHRELVLLSDGAATRGRVDEALRVASARDIPVHVVPLGPPALRTGVVRLVPLQDQLHGDEVTVEAHLDSNAPVTGELTLLANGRSVATASVGFGPGPHTETLTFTPDRGGVHDLRVELAVAGDARPDDDVGLARLRVKPRPTALVVGPSEQARALRAAVAGYVPELRVEARTELPAPPYDDHSMVVVLDPDLKALDGKRTRGLVDYVGGGGRLLMTGGQQGLVTDETQTEVLAEILPVKFPKTKKKQRAPLSVVYCLDTSDSMANGAKFELAAAALAQSLYLLPEGGRVGILGFSDLPHWVHPLSDFMGSDPVIGALSQVRVRGGTSIYHALQQAYDALKADDALVKHVVLLSDGQSTTTFARHGDVVTAMLRRRITVSTIAVSADSDRSEMERIAEAGGGRAYYAKRFDQLPQLFLDEMMQVTRTNKIDKEFDVHPVVGSRFLERLPEDPGYPALKGYVRGEQRPGTELALATADGHPVLVAGRYKRGQVVLFTSDVGGAWSQEWQDWEQHGALWEGVVEALLRPEPPDRLALRTRVEGRTATIEYDAMDPLMNPRGDLVVEAIVDPTDGDAYAVPLAPTGPGRYAATVQLPEAGAALIRTAAVGTTIGRDGPPAPGGELLASVAATPPEEVRAATFNPRALRRIAEQTRGLYAPTPAEVFGSDAPERIVREARHAMLLWAALALLLLDLGWRRLRIPGR
ncbi:MAG: VWA domain-containing protein [Proteobacteria bacterium]|nr:VWA domain-containing protein [Pseudomonadota bacterium]